MWYNGSSVPAGRPPGAPNTRRRRKICRSARAHSGKRRVRHVPVRPAAGGASRHPHPGGRHSRHPVLAGIHPDVITVRDPDHKNIAVDVVRAIRADAYIRPNEGRRKVYVFPDCALLTEQDQNVLLKVVEEGPPYAAFLFCAENAAVVLQTLRSRCVELKLHPAAEGGGEEVQAAEALCRCLAARKRGKVTELAVRLEKKRITREDLSALLERSRALCAAALLLQYGQEPEESCREIAPILAKNLTKSQIMRTIELLQKYRGECTYNVGTPPLSSP